MSNPTLECLSCPRCSAQPKREEVTIHDNGERQTFHRMRCWNSRCLFAGPSGESVDEAVRNWNQAARRKVGAGI